MNIQNLIQLFHVLIDSTPNPECESNKDEKKREVIFIRYDDVNVKYIYLCAVCNTSWKTDESN